MSFAKRSKKKLKGEKWKKEEPKKPEPVVDAAPPTPAPPVPAPEPADADILEEQQRRERNVNIFRDWLGGSSFAKLSKKYSISIQRIAMLSKQYKWKSLREEMRRREYRQTIAKARSIAAYVQDVLESDARKIVDTASKEKRMLTPDERAHFRALHDRFLKEIRLEEGQPTELPTSGPHQLEIILPPGAKRFGVTPPSPHVKVIEATPAQKEDRIDLEDLDND